MHLREHFKPIQPAVTSTSAGVLYEESLPHPALSAYVYCYWQLKTVYKLSTPFSYRVIPDGCIEIFFYVNDPLDNRVMGFSTASTSFGLDATFHYAGIRFMPAAFPLIFNVDASELTDRAEQLDVVVPTAAKKLTDIFESNPGFQGIKASLDQYLLMRVEDIRHNEDRRLQEAIFTILKTHGSLNLDTALDIGISPRQLRRLFDFYVGNSPKVFSKVIRFQYFFQLLSSAKSQEYNKLFLEAGYYDQPHFNKDFKTFFGLTPTEALR